MQFWRYGQPIESLGGKRYTLEGLLGSGSMAEVWKAYDEEKMRDVAIKILKPEFSDQETMNRFGGFAESPHAGESVLLTINLHDCTPFV